MSESLQNHHHNVVFFNSVINIVGDVLITVVTTSGDTCRTPYQRFLDSCGTLIFEMTVGHAGMQFPVLAQDQYFPTLKLA